MSQAKAKYVDLNTYLGVVSDDDVLRDEAAIINTFLNIITIPKRTRKFRARFGSSLHSFLGLPVNSVNALRMRDSLLKDLAEYQPYAIVRANDVVITPMENRAGYNLYITYQSKLTGLKSSGAFQLAANLSR